MPEPLPLQQIDRTYVRFGKRKLSYFAGCDYFRLASHPLVLKAVGDGLKKFGLNVAASRLTTGHHAIYDTLEQEIAAFFASETAVLISSGYMTNLVAAQALKGTFSHVLIDEKAHPSLADASTFLDCPILKLQHRSPEDLRRITQRLGKGIRPILLTDGMFSHDGGIAPLQAYQKILSRDSWMLVDDAHGAGTLGATGKGSVELEGVQRRQLIQTITLSKAFGVYGGAIVCDRQVREQIFSNSRMFVGNTPLPLPLANAALHSVKLLRREKGLRRRLVENVKLLKAEAARLGFPLNDSPSPIFPVIPKDAAHADRLRARLLANGVFPSFIKYPGGPQDGYFRFVIASEHSRAQILALARSLAPAT
ncbi:MAG: Aminotransferase class [Verrucomicrobiales bacterium]|nr:Aminotransferase class [Verrucomicrobiales bacterium]